MEEVEIAEDRDNYEIIPVTPIRRLEKRMEDIEKSGSIPQLQSLINHIIDLMKTNQDLIEQVLKADDELRKELSRIPSKVDELISTMKSFMDLIKIAGEEEVSAPAQVDVRPMADQFQKLLEQNQKIVESNQRVIEALENINRKLKSGTPVSSILSSYPGLKLRGEQR